MSTPTQPSLTTWILEQAVKIRGTFRTEPGLLYRLGLSGQRYFRSDSPKCVYACVSETHPAPLQPSYPPRRARSPSSGRQGGGIGLVFVFDAKEPSAEQGRLAMAGPLTRYANARCPPLCCLGTSQKQPGQGGLSGPALRPPGGAGAVPDCSGPQGPWLQPRGRARVTSPKGAAASREGRPRGWEPLQVQRRGGPAGACPQLLPGRQPDPSPPREPPPPSPGPGPSGAGGARRGSTCAPSRAGESPGEHVPRCAGGGESRGRLHCCCCCRRGRRCLFLPPAPSPPRPGRGAPRAELGRAGRSGRRAPQAAAAAAATVVAAAVRAGKLCPFVRSAPEAAGRQRCLLQRPDPGGKIPGETAHSALTPPHPHLLT
ncbi:collagen alpha-1(III) chain-like [Sapajus apella]|uniref:Collagen alpha-1(III) chain-like n=1 Tax=Sapajus apella TaxID=9515 RepID=A0A6J3HEI4_SAPAP|nr:collagen alpha-1(III) chain-like [Sapajus apella]